MKRRFTEQQIIGFLKEASAGMPVKELCRKHGFSDASFYTWCAKFGALIPNLMYADSIGPTHCAARGRDNDGREVHWRARLLTLELLASEHVGAHQ